MKDNNKMPAPSFSRKDVVALLEQNDLKKLLTLAGEIRDAAKGRRFSLCSIDNVRSGLCGEDCAFCAQSVHHRTGVDAYPFKSPYEVLAKARNLEARGVRRFSLVTSGGTLDSDEITKIIEIVRVLKRETSLEVCASLGMLDMSSLELLYAAGVRRYHHNLETGPQWYPVICTTHTFDDRVRTLRNAREVGMELCSGGIIGMGETMGDRLDMAETLLELRVESVPLNILTPIEGTPLESMPILDTDEILETLAALRLMLPDAEIRLAGGRKILGERLPEALHGGVTGAITGDYLTTAGYPVEDDIALLQRCGFVISDC